MDRGRWRSRSFYLREVGVYGVVFKTKEGIELDNGLIGFEQEGDRRFFVSVVTRTPPIRGVGVGTEEGEFAFATK